MLRKVVGLLLFIGLPYQVMAEEKPLQLMASIKPLQLLVSALIEEGDSVSLLLAPGQSPHDYQLKPSDRIAMNEAQLLVWMGPRLERFLTKPVSLLPAAQRLSLLPEAEGLEAAGQHDEHDHHHHGHAVDDDPHRWLDPLQAIAMAEQISRQLIELAPERQAQWQANFQAFAQAMHALNQQLQQQFSTQPKPYMVLHDAYGHFEARYGIRRLAALSISPERQPGAKHIWQLKQQIATGEVACVFREPQYQPKILNNLLAGSGVRTGLLDPLATAFSPSKTAFQEFLAGFAKALADCLYTKADA